MAEEKLIILVFAEAVFVLTVTIVVLITYIRGLKKKIAPTSNSSTEINEVDEDNKGNWPPEKFLSEEIKATNSVYFSLVGTVIPATADATMSAITDKKLLVMLLRYYYLQAELDVLNLREDFEAFWGTLTQSLLGLIPLLPSSQAGKEEVTQLHTEIHHLKNQYKEMEVYQQAFLLLQSLVRTHLSSSSTQKLLALTEEITLLKTGNAIELLETHYKAFFEEINALLSKHAQSQETLVDDEKNPSPNKTSEHKTNIITQLHEFLSVLREQKSLPNDQLNQCHNLIVDLTDVHKNHEKQLEKLQRSFNESQVCNTFLETELTSAQETVRSLLEIIEEKNADKNQ
jgi:hypothetical protein